jgi:chorismate synthase
MNTFGRIFRLSIFGESHGPLVGITIDGCPAGISLSTEDFTDALFRRQGGNAIATTPRKESDVPKFVSGLFNGFTTGAPLTIIFENNNTDSSTYEKQRQIPRPGHADFVASVKFSGFEDYRGSGHFSGRLTVCLVAAGIVAQKILNRNRDNNQRINCNAFLVEAGGNSNIEEAIANAVKDQDSIGGIVKCEVKGLPIGWGNPFFDSVESLISHAVFAIPAIKGIEFGSGFSAASMKGSEHNDVLLDDKGTLHTNHSGGVLGGITTGGKLEFKVAVKPTSSTPKTQHSYNKETDRVEEFTVKGRHDLCIALRVPVVVEAVTYCVLADLMMLQQSTGV